MKKKLAGAIIVGTFAVTSLFGAATYAYFGSVKTSGVNKFQTGRIALTGFRNDIPIQGPMFYTDDVLDSGILGTGLWKPGDSHTRGFFVQNPSTATALNVKLKSLTVLPDGDTDTATLTEFSKQAYLTISLIKRGTKDIKNADPLFTQDNEGDVVTGRSQIEYANSVKDLDTKYKTQLNNLLIAAGYNDPTKTLAERKQMFLAAQDALKEWLLTSTFSYTDPETGDPVHYYIQKVFQGPLEDILNNPYFVTAPTSPTGNPEEFYLAKGEGRYFGYTVTFDDLDPSENNKLQGKTIYLKFIQDWVAR